MCVLACICTTDLLNQCSSLNCSHSPLCVFVKLTGEIKTKRRKIFIEVCFKAINIYN